MTGTAALLSFRLGGTDGVAIEARKWSWALGQLGWRVVTLAGDGTPDRRLPGLAIGEPTPPTDGELADALADVDLVVVENLCSLPLNPGALATVARVLAGRPAVLHHHDLPWQRRRFRGWPPPPTDPAWAHVTINEISRRQLARHGIEATVIHNTFDPDPPAGDRAATRRRLGLAPDDLLVCQPTRALPRKNVPGAIAHAAALAALLPDRRTVYWLLGPAEDGYDSELAGALAASPVRSIHGSPDGSPLVVADAYAACDVVTLPSWWEGFGNPAIESALARRPLVVGPYPVARELAANGFRWFPHDDARPLAHWLAEPDLGLLDANQAVARRSFSLLDLPSRLATILPPAPPTSPADHRPAPGTPTARPVAAPPPPGHRTPSSPPPVRRTVAAPPPGGPAHP